MISQMSKKFFLLMVSLQEISTDCWTKILHFMNVKTWNAIRQTCSHFHKNLPIIVKCGPDVLVQHKLEIYSGDTFLTEQYVEIILNNNRIIRLFFFCGNDKRLYLHSLNLTCLTIHCHVQLSIAFACRDDIIFSSSGSFLKFAQKHVNKDKEYVISELQKFLCM